MERTIETEKQRKQITKNKQEKVNQPDNQLLSPSSLILGPFNFRDSAVFIRSRRGVHRSISGSLVTRSSRMESRLVLGLHREDCRDRSGGACRGRRNRRRSPVRRGLVGLVTNRRSVCFRSNQVLSGFCAFL